MNTAYHRFVVAVLVLVVLAPGCGESEKKAAATEANPAKEPAAEPDEKPSARGQGRVWRTLVDDASRAELRAGGLIIDLGTADQHKYTRGGWRTSWDESDADETTAAAVTGRKAVLDVLLDRPPAELVVRARSAVSGQRLRVNIDEVVLETEEIPSEWTEVRIPIPEGKVGPGHHQIDLRFRRGGNPRAEVDWIWLAAEAEAEIPPHGPRALPLTIGERPKRALVAPTPRTYSFYVEPADGEKLVADVASEVGAELAIQARVDGAEPESLWSGEAGDDWREVAVDLSPLAGKAVRLDLVASGASGVTGWGAPVLMRPADERPARGAARPANVLLLVIDTVRADVFDSGEVQTPNYDALVPESTRFVNAYNNENWTKPSVATILSGLYPSTHQTKQDASKLPEEIEILPQRLGREGFATAGFVANGYVSGAFGFEKGWDTFTNYIRESRSSEAEHVYADALEWLEGRDDEEPFFLYVQSIDPHVPYRVGEEYSGRYYEGKYTGSLGTSVAAAEQVALSKQDNPDPDDVAWLAALYNGEVTYHDHHMGQFFDALRERGLLEDTLVVITNDHGEELGGRGKFGHGHSLYEEMIRAPLMMRLPGLIPEGEVVEEAVEHVDLVPTVLDALGLPPAPQAEGQSLLPLVFGQPVSRPTYAVTEFLSGRRSIRIGRYKFMRSAGDWMHLFDLADDPAESDDLVDSMPIARRLCEVHLGEALAVPAKTARQDGLGQRQEFEAGKADIGPKVRRQLEALGYFGTRAEPEDEGKGEGEGE